MRYRFAYFDVANTLLEIRGLVDALVEVFATHGTRLDAWMVRDRHKLLSEVTRFPDRTDRAFYDGFNGDLCLALGVIPHRKLLDDIYARCRSMSWQPFGDVNALADLHLPLGILSNWDTSLEAKLLASIGPMLRFERVIGSQSSGMAKPDPAIFALALDGLDCSPSEVLFVGDSLRLDIAPALACGIDAVLLDRYALYPAYRGKSIRSLDDLIGLSGE